MCGSLDERAMRCGLLSVVARQHSMRTVFYQRGFDGPCQEVYSLTECYQSINFEEINEEEYDDLVAAELAYEFDLNEIPFRIIPRKIGNRYEMIFSQNHIITDGWSMTVFARDLSTAYHHYIGRGDKLGPLAVSIADIAGWQKSENHLSSLKEDLEALKNRLAGKKATRILPCKTRQLKISKKCDRLSIMLPKEVSDRADTMASKHKSTAYAVYLAYFLQTARAWSEEEDRDDVVIGCPISGRSRPEMNDLFGYFLNNVIVDVKVKVGDPIESIIENVRNSNFRGLLISRKKMK